jgi:hypothetical protein
MPKLNRETLSYLCKFIRQLSRYSDVRTSNVEFFCININAGNENGGVKLVCRIFAKLH